MKMKRIIKLVLLLLLSIGLSFSLSDIVQSGGKHSSSYKSSSYGSKSVRVKGYTRKDGTYVAPHYRSAPKSTGSNYKPSKSFKSYNSSPAVGVERDSEGHIKRSSSAKREFLKSRGLDEVPEGYEVDHIVPLYKGGADEPYNMQLLPEDVHKQKTKRDLAR